MEKHDFKICAPSYIKINHNEKNDFEKMSNNFRIKLQIYINT